LITVFSQRICIHIAKAPQANALTKALSKSMQADPMKKRNFKKCPTHRTGKKTKKMTERKIEIRTDRKRKHETLTGVCCQWRGSASYDSDVHIETFVLRRKFSDEIATEQQPPNRQTV